VHVCEKIAKEIEEDERIDPQEISCLETEEGIALDRHFKLLIELLRFFVDSPGMRATKMQRLSLNLRGKKKRNKKKEKKQARRSSIL